MGNVYGLIFLGYLPRIVSGRFNTNIEIILDTMKGITWALGINWDDTPVCICRLYK